MGTPKKSSNSAKSDRASRATLDDALSPDVADPTPTGTDEDGGAAGRNDGRNEKERGFVLDLLQRSLGLRHKIKVHDSMRAPETHEEIAVTTLARWELEDELSAIEALLGEARGRNVAHKRKRLLEVGPKVKKKLGR